MLAGEGCHQGSQGPRQPPACLPALGPGAEGLSGVVLWCLWVLRQGSSCEAAHDFRMVQETMAGKLTLTLRPWRRWGAMGRGSPQD